MLYLPALSALPLPAPCLQAADQLSQVHRAIKEERVQLEDQELPGSPWRKIRCKIQAGPGANAGAHRWGRAGGPPGMDVMDGMCDG